MSGAVTPSAARYALVDRASGRPRAFGASPDALPPDIPGAVVRPWPGPGFTWARDAVYDAATGERGAFTAAGPVPADPAATARAAVRGMRAALQGGAGTAATRLRAIELALVTLIDALPDDTS